MISLKQEVRALLEKTGAKVWYFYPASWVSLPVIAWHESGNRELRQADGREHLAELSYTVDVWGDSPEKLDEIAREADRLLTGMRLRRDWSRDVYEPATGLHMRAAKYRCVADAEGNIYQ